MPTCNLLHRYQVSRNVRAVGFSADSKIILVEFMRSHRELNTEWNKFIHYENTAKAPKGQDKHHFPVYG